MTERNRGGTPNMFSEIIYEDCAAALDWLARAFGFVRGAVIEGPGGTIAHAEMHLGAGTIMPKSPVPDWEMRGPRVLGGITQCIYVTVEDTDAHYAKAKANGAQILMEPTDLDYGARNHVARDLEGHLWSFGTYSPTQPADQPTS